MRFEWQHRGSPHVHGLAWLRLKLIDRAGQRSYVKLLRGRREELGNEAMYILHNARVIVMCDMMWPATFARSAGAPGGQKGRSYI